MIDRLIPLLLAATLACPAVVRPPCCCAQAAQQGDACPVADVGGAEPTAAKPSCCVAEVDLAPCYAAAADLAPCCRSETPAPSPLDPCKCDGCLSARPDSPLAAAPAAPRPPSVDDLPLAWGVSPVQPPAVASLVGAVGVPLDSHPLDRPPPDRQALFCVWTI